MRLFRDQIESFKYVNHLWPVLILRLFTSYFFFSRYQGRINDGYLTQPKISAAVDEFLYANNPPAWVESFYVNIIQSNWSFYAKVVVNLEWTLALLFLIGLLNRPAAILSLIFLYLGSFISAPVDQGQFLPMAAILFTLIVFGSGRVGGFDYSFYKRQRGLIW